MKANHLLAAALLAIAGGASASQFNFGYKFDGERSIQPLQVFDDGVNTYFQFRGGNKVVPAIIAESRGAGVVANYSSHGPYVVVPGVASSFRLQYGSMSATIVGNMIRPSTVGADRATEAPAAGAVAVAASPAPAPTVQRVVAYGAVNPIGSSAAVQAAAAPARTMPSVTTYVPFSPNISKLGNEGLTKVRNALKGDGEVTSVSIIGRDDSNFKEGVASGRARAIRDVLIRYGIDASVIVMREGLPREGDSEKKPTSDLVITRTIKAPSAMTAALNAAEMVTVQGAVQLVNSGLKSLVKLGALSEERAGAISSLLSRSIVSAPVAPAQQTVAPAEPAQETWTMGPADGTAKAALAKWATKGGYELDWRATVDYPVASTITQKGHVLSAVGHVMGLLKAAKVPLTWRVEGTKLVVEG